MNEQDAHIMSFETLTALSYFTDSRRQVWKLRVFTIGDSPGFGDVIGTLLEIRNQKEEQAARIYFLQECLQTSHPSIIIGFRRMFGLPDFSTRQIMKRVASRDFNDFRNAIVKANTGKTFDDYLNDILEELKKKMENQPTGAI